MWPLIFIGLTVLAGLLTPWAVDLLGERAARRAQCGKPTMIGFGVDRRRAWRPTPGTLMTDRDAWLWISRRPIVRPLRLEPSSLDSNVRSVDDELISIVNYAEITFIDGTGRVRVGAWNLVALKAMRDTVTNGTAPGAGRMRRMAAGFPRWVLLLWMITAIGFTPITLAWVNGHDSTATVLAVNEDSMCHVRPSGGDGWIDCDEEGPGAVLPVRVLGFPMRGDVGDLETAPTIREIVVSIALVGALAAAPGLLGGLRHPTTLTPAPSPSLTKEAPARPQQATRVEIELALADRRNGKASWDEIAHLMNRGLPHSEARAPNRWGWVRAGAKLWGGSTFALVVLALLVGVMAGFDLAVRFSGAPTHQVRVLSDSSLSPFGFDTTVELPPGAQKPPENFMTSLQRFSRGDQVEAYVTSDGTLPVDDHLPFVEAGLAIGLLLIAIGRPIMASGRNQSTAGPREERPFAAFTVDDGSLVALLDPQQDPTQRNPRHLLLVAQPVPPTGILSLRSPVKPGRWLAPMLAGQRLTQVEESEPINEHELREIVSDLAQAQDTW